MKGFLNRNREVLLPVLSSLVFHLMLILLLDEVIDLNIKLPEKKPQYVFIEPVMLQNLQKANTINKDMMAVQEKVKKLKEVKPVEKKVQKKIEKKVIKAEKPDLKKVNIKDHEINKMVLDKKNIKTIDIAEKVLEKKTVQTDVIRLDKEIALIEKEEVVLSKKTIDTGIDIKKEKIDLFSKDESVEVNIKEEIESQKQETISFDDENINIEIESFNKEIKEIPKILSLVKPDYPKWAIQAEYQGFVKFKLNINTAGNVAGIVKYQSDLPSELIAYTADYIRKWIFKPLMINNQAVESEILVTIKYELEIN